MNEFNRFMSSSENPSISIDTNQPHTSDSNSKKFFDTSYGASNTTPAFRFVTPVKQFTNHCSVNSFSPGSSSGGGGGGNCSNLRHFKKALIYSSTNYNQKSDLEDETDRKSPLPKTSSPMPINLCVSSTSTSVKQPKSSTFPYTKEEDDDLPLNLHSDVAKSECSTEDFSKYSSDGEKIQSESMQIDEYYSGKDEDKEMEVTPDMSKTKSPVNSILMASPSMSQMPQMVTHVGRKPLNGPPCSLKTLVDDNILDPLDGSLTYEIMGSKFFGDLLPNGFIRLSGTTQLFANPSSWANYCRSTIPSCSKDHKNYGSAWSIIRYLGKRLDSYKLRWYRKQKKQFTGNGAPTSTPSTSSTFSPINSSNNSLLMKGKNSLDTLMASYTSLQNFPLSTNNYNNMRGFNYFPQTSTPNLPRSTSTDFKNIASIMNRERLYKLDKLSIGDLEINAEKVNDENIYQFNSIDLNNKELSLGKHAKIACVPFNTTYCMQPFQVTVSTNVLLLVDFHSHLISSEVSGYLAGTWDPRLQHLNITQAYPLREKLIKNQKGHVHKIQQSLLEKGLVLVGWYHSHPNTFPHPTILDIKRQLNYQKQFLSNSKGQLDYSPCIGLITSPFYQRVNRLTSLFQMFWVMPVFTANNRDIGRPMQISYNISRDAFLTQDLLVEMRMLATHFCSHSKFVKFTLPFTSESSNWDKLQESLKIKLPRDLVEAQPQTVQNDIQQQALMHFWSFLKNLLFIN